MDGKAQGDKITGRGSGQLPVPKHQPPSERQPMSTVDSTVIVRSYKFRLWTNANQDRELAITLETHRRLYNAVLDGKQLCWATAGANWSFREQSRWFAVHRKTNPYYARLNFSSAEQTLRRLDRTFERFYNRTSGYPKFKSRDRFNSFVYKCPAVASDGCKLIAGKLRLQHIGTIRVRWHRDLPSGTLKQVCIVRENGKWYAVFAIAIPAPPLTVKTETVGIDVGLSSFVTTSRGDQLGDSRSLERALPELRRRQRSLARCRCGSNRRRKVKRAVTSLYAKARDSRRDMHHKVARSLVDRYGTIVAESLNVQGMLKNRRLARRISDAGWSGFLTILAGKAEASGGQVLLVDPKHTSQVCSACGATVRKSLAVRVHRCECGCVLDRDHNAAINILERGQAWTAPESRNAEVALHGTRSPTGE